MSKIPLMDEGGRCISSVIDWLTGNEDRAKTRWANYYEDSMLGTAVATTFCTVGAAVCGDTNRASKLIEAAGNHGEKLGAVVISAAASAGGIAAQLITLGIPNPISGALNESAAGINEMISEAAAGTGGPSYTKRVDWEKLGRESTIGLIKGAVSSGGLIPYLGKLAENEIRKDFCEALCPDQVNISHAEEWGKAGLNIGLSLLTVGTVKSLQAGSMGAAEAVTLAVSSGTIAGIGSGLISKESNSGATRRSMCAAGYILRIEFERTTGRPYARYSKYGNIDVYIALPDIGNIMEHRIFQGVMTGLTVRQEERFFDLSGVTYKEISEAAYMSRFRRNHHDHSPLRSSYMLQPSPPSGPFL